jgi:hypothetical protein
MHLITGVLYDNACIYVGKLQCIVLLPVQQLYKTETRFHINNK